MAKLKIPVVVDIDAVEELVEELKHLPIYKLGADDDLILVDRGAVAAIFARHVKAKQREERKKGKWEIDVDCEYDVFDIAGERTWAIKATCSECGFTMSFIEGHGVFKYCPNCGARMQAED